MEPPSPIRLGRAVVAVFEGSKLRVGVNGTPVCQVAIPAICQPPANADA